MVLTFIAQESHSLSFLPANHVLSQGEARRGQIVKEDESIGEGEVILIMNKLIYYMLL